MYDTVVIGGGLLGLATAYHLVQQGQSVAVVDRHDGGRATDAGAGILSANTSLGLDGDELLFAGTAGDYYPTLIEALGADGAGDTGYGSTPVLVVAMADDNPARFAQVRERLMRRKASGIVHAEVLQELTPDEARTHFPVLGEVAGAIYSGQGARVDGRLLMAALRTAGEHRGLAFQQGSVERVVVEQSRVAGVTVAGERVAASNVVVAGGAWSRSLLEPLGIDLPVSPQRGQILHVGIERASLGEAPAVVGLRGHYILPWPDGHVVMGATRETGSGFTPELTARGTAEVLAEGLRVAPGLGAAAIREWRVGLRPLADDQRPILGGVPGTEGLYLATGHGAGGLLQGPYGSKLLADGIASGTMPDALAPYALTRFARWQR